MKFSALFASILLVSCMTSFAQDSKKSSFNILMGPSLPISDFGDKDISDPNAGLAKTGAFLALEYDHRLLNKIYFTGRLSGSINGVDFAYSAPTGSALKMSMTNWKNANVFVGFSYIHHISTRFKLIARTLGGLQYTRSPEVKIAISGVFNGNSTQESAGATSLGVLLGVGFNYNISQNLGLRLIADYGAAKPTFDIKASGSGISNELSSSQNVNLINLGIGMSFKL